MRTFDEWTTDGPNWPSRLPHWHRQSEPRYKGDRSSPKWHRPWETWWRKR